MGIATKVSKLHKSFDSLIPVQEARRILGKAMKLPIVPENISLDQAAGRMVISDFFAQESSPGFPRSAMDGYAVRSADIENASLEHPVRIRVGGDILIGEVPHRAGKDATCMKIPTGGYVPEPFDAVIPVERATLDGEDIIAIDPDASAERIRTGIARRTGVFAAVIVTDTFGRPWRRGQTNVSVTITAMPAIQLAVHA